MPDEDINFSRYIINTIIDHLTEYEAEQDRRYKELDNRIQRIANNQLKMKRGERTEPYIPQICWCGQVDCMGAEVEAGGIVHRPDKPCYELEKEQPKRWPKTGDLIYCFNSQGQILEQRWHDTKKQKAKREFLGLFPTREAAEAYKARLLELDQQV